MSAYDLIMKNKKEKLLSFNEPTRFIFSHSALREGWDNQMYSRFALLNTANQISAETGNWPRIAYCVNEHGERGCICAGKRDSLKLIN